MVEKLRQDRQASSGNHDFARMIWPLVGRTILVLLLIVLMLMALAYARLAWRSPAELQATFFPFAECQPPMIWAHRAAPRRGEGENSMEAIERALADGYCGIELDVHFVNGDFLISHDGRKPGTETLRLSEVLRSHGAAQRYWWLDFKNLQGAGVKAATNRLRDLVKGITPPPWLLVESMRHDSLRDLQMELPEVKTMSWLAPAPHLNGWKQRVALALFILLHDPKALSMNLADFERLPAIFYQNRIVMVFTVNDPTRIRRAFERGADVVLSDKAPQLGARIEDH